MEAFVLREVDIHGEPVLIPGLDSNNTKGPKGIANMSGSVVDTNADGETVTIATIGSSTNHQTKTQKPKSPKRMFVGYTMFSKERRSQLKSSNPEMTNVEVIRQISKEWFKLSPEKIMKYKERASQERLNYEQALTLGINPNVKFQDCKIKKGNPDWVITSEGDMKVQKNIYVPAMATTSSSFAKNTSVSKSKAEAATGMSPETSSISIITELRNSSEGIPIFTDEYLKYSHEREQAIMEMEKLLKDSKTQNEILTHNESAMREKLMRLDEEARILRNDNRPYADAHCFRQLTLCLTILKARRK